MDVKNYGQYFNSAGEFVFSEVRRYSGAVEGYHLLPVDLPFMKDREYFFRVHTGGYDIEDNVSIVHWYLIDKPEKVQTQNTSKMPYTLIMEQDCGWQSVLMMVSICYPIACI